MSDARRIIVVRHGQTAWNAARRIQGQLDAELDEVGLEQARAVAPVIAADSPAQVWASDLARARVTAETVAKESGLEVRLDERLREFGLGAFEGLTHDELAERDATAYERFRLGEWDDIPGAETSAQVADRYGAALSDLAAALAPGQTGVAVSHGAATRVGVVRFLGWPLEVARDLRGLANCARVLLEERPGGGWTMASYNV